MAVFPEHESSDTLLTGARDHTVAWLVGVGRNTSKAEEVIFGTQLSFPLGPRM